GQSQAQDPLPKQLFDAVLHQIALPSVLEARGKPSQDSPTTIHLPQQQETSIRGQSPPIEGGHQRPTRYPLKLKLLRITVCRHGAVLLSRYKSCWHNTYTTRGGSVHLFREKSGLGHGQFCPGRGIDGRLQCTGVE